MGTRRLRSSQSLINKSLHRNTNIIQYHFCQKTEENKNEKETDKNDEKKEEKSFFSQLEQSWNKAKDEMNRQKQEQEQQQQQQTNNNAPLRNEEEHKEWIEKYDAIREENKFEIASMSSLDFK